MKANISKRCCKHLKEMQGLLNAKGNARKLKLKNVTTGCIRAITDALVAIINKRVPMKDNQLRNLRQKENAVLHFVDKGTKVNDKRRMLVQDGGFIGLIAPFLRMAAPLLGTLVKPLLNTFMGGNK